MKLDREDFEDFMFERVTRSKIKTDEVELD
jgi:hypothetical protein